MPLDNIDKLRAAIDRGMIQDQPRLRKMLRAARDRLKNGLPADRLLDKVRSGAARSAARREKREHALLTVTYPPELPISARRDEIARAIEQHQVIVLCGETGSGKTTQLPKICLELGRGRAGMIGHTQPRRVAARTMAARVAEELGTTVGREVGYKIRFGDAVSEQTLIKIMTDGMLLAETRHDPKLLAYDTIIIDEAHERSLNIDFLLGYLQRLLPQRPDIKIIVTSATIDPKRFSDHFGGAERAPMIEVSGRTYPVEERYRPLIDDDGDAADRDQADAIVEAVREAATLGPGDMLVFLAGERDIHEMAKTLRPLSLPGGPTEVLPLYARLPAREQNRVFQSHASRRIVLATNVAETSLTVPGVRYVIDPGVARISRYSPRSGVQRLPIEPISQASAEQRKGRCGRVSEGVCFRLYTEDDFRGREPYTPPEIQRTNLASVILQMKSLGLGNVEDFPFIDPPRMTMVSDACQTLFELGALDQWGELTPLGRTLAQFPIDPRLARMVLAGADEGVLRETLIVAAAMSIQDPRERPHDAQQQADEAHETFRHEGSDVLTLLNLWSFWRDRERQLSQGRLSKVCKQHFLSYVRMREWEDTYHQLLDLATEHGLASAEARGGEPVEDRIHRAVAFGLLSRIGVRGEGYEYSGADNKTFFIFPASSAFNAPPRWLVAGELIETSRLFAHTVVPVQPEWFEWLAAHLVKRNHFDPHWHRKSQRIMAYERVTLFGLELVARRRVHFGPIDPTAARQMFINRALVEGELRTDAPFLAHNAAVIEDIRALEHKGRRKNILVDEHMRFRFYDERVPADIVTGRQFDAWRRKIEKGDPKYLFMTRDSLITAGATLPPASEFPDALIVRGARLPLEYRFEPGHEEDGITLAVPLEFVNQLDARQLAWLVPGRLAEKVTELLRALPKPLRRNFVPAPDFAAAAVARLEVGRGALSTELSRVLREMTGVEISDNAWQMESIPDHLRMNIRVVDDEGSVLAASRDLAELRRSLGGDAARAAAESTARDRDDRASAFHRDGITAWDFGELPTAITVQRGGVDLAMYPALVDHKRSVALRLMDTSELASRATRSGLRRLVMLQFPEEMRHLARLLPGVESLAVQWTALGLGDQASLREQMVSLIVDRAFLELLDNPAASVRDAASFGRMIDTGWHRSDAAAEAVGALVTEMLEQFQHVSIMLDELASPALRATIDEVRGQANDLFAPGFLLNTPLNWLEQYPRYLRAIEIRLNKAANGRLARDRALANELAPIMTRYAERAIDHERQGVIDPVLERYRWLLEEYRVALFAQELGTAVRVSLKRLEEQWSRIRM